jgi:glycosyltransferase involved in cell wall biosynthesis
MVSFERAQCQRFTGIVTVSEVDKKILETEFGARRVFAVPTGVDTDYFRRDESVPEEGGLVFCGAMDWLPNEDAAIYFVDEVLPRIKAEIPTVTLTLVGRNPSRRLLARIGNRTDVRVTGWVDDVRPFVRRSMLYVIPLRIGGGTRIKAYEAMAMGKAVISTPIGVEGLPLTDGEHVLLAEGAQAFADAVVGLLRDPERRRRIEGAARELVERNFGWERAASVFSDACSTVAGR